MSKGITFHIAHPYCSGCEEQFPWPCEAFGVFQWAQCPTCVNMVRFSVSVGRNPNLDADMSIVHKMEIVKL